MLLVKQLLIYILFYFTSNLKECLFNKFFLCCLAKILFQLYKLNYE